MLVGVAFVLAASACGGSKKKAATVDAHGCVVTPAPSPGTRTEKKPSTKLADATSDSTATSEFIRVSCA